MKQLSHFRAKIEAARSRARAREDLAVAKARKELEVRRQAMVAQDRKGQTEPKS